LDETCEWDSLCEICGLPQLAVWLWLDAVALALDVPAEEITRWRRLRKIRCRRRGGRWEVEHDSLDRFLESARAPRRPTGASEQCADRAERNCLVCHRPFLSEGPANRTCTRCQKQREIEGIVPKDIARLSLGDGGQRIGETP